MQKFTSLSRKTLLNYSSGWQFIISIYKYPIILYINLHNINNYNLHQIKHYMFTINGHAQVLNTNQLVHLFGQNIKFKFMITGNIVALTFEKWQDVWNFDSYYKQLNLLIVTVSLKGVFLNLGTDSISFLQNLYEQHYTRISDMTTQLSKKNICVLDYLTGWIFMMVNMISVILYQFTQIIVNFSQIINLKQIH